MPVQTQCWNSKIGGTTACNSVISSSSDRSTNRQRRRHGIRKAVHYDNLDCQVSSFRRQSFHQCFQLTASLECSPYFLKKASPPILQTDWAACGWQQDLLHRDLATELACSLATDRLAFFCWKGSICRVLVST